MARVSVSVALLFFFLTLSRSVARMQISRPKYDVTVHQFTNPLPESDVKPSILLPSQSKHQPEKNDQEIKPVEHLPDLTGPKAQPVEQQAVSNEENKKPTQPLNGKEARPIVENKHSELPIDEDNKPIDRPLEIDEAKEAKPKSTKVDAQTQSKPIERQPESNNEVAKAQPQKKVGAAAVKAVVPSVPLMQVRFRPINHQFGLRSRLPYRLCRHNHCEEIMPSRSHVQIPYSNGMMLTIAENSNFDQEVFLDGGVSHVPQRLFPLVHHQLHEEKVSNHFSDHGSLNHIPPKWIRLLHRHQQEEKASNDQEKPKNFHHHGGDEVENVEEKRHGKQEATLRRRIRKFLGNYFD